LLNRDGLISPIAPGGARRRAAGKEKSDAAKKTRKTRTRQLKKGKKIQPARTLFKTIALGTLKPSETSQVGL
jgi:hypothetical protein